MSNGKGKSYEEKGYVPVSISSMPENEAGYVPPKPPIDSAPKPQPSDSEGGGGGSGDDSSEGNQ
ncbi:MAG: hypothetical protein IMF11_03470 [Proteobacteria bacterium]|nr:hypothetical protein [Pseudomonadota bacterium]MCK4487265.1 hypothetical protein [Desulfobacterales bacterium]